MNAFVASTELVHGPKLYTLKEDLWLPFYNDLGITREFHQGDGWYHVVQAPDGRWWLHLVAGFQWDGATKYPDWGFMKMPSAKHDACHWLIMHGIIPESMNNMIDKELEDSILLSKTKIRFREGGFIPRKIRARMIRRATNTANEKRDLDGQEHYNTTIAI